jgi:hypothetical protein
MKRARMRDLSIFVLLMATFYHSLWTCQYIILDLNLGVDILDSAIQYEP